MGAIEGSFLTFAAPFIVSLIFMPRFNRRVIRNATKRINERFDAMNTKKSPNLEDAWDGATHYAENEGEYVQLVEPLTKLAGGIAVRRENGEEWFAWRLIPLANN